MKLTKKLTVILTAGLAVGFLTVSGAALWQMRSQSISVAVDNYGKQMDSIAYAFSEIGSREEFENLGDIAAEAYLKYQFRRCYKEGYALLKGDECLVNLTDYEILSPGLLKGNYMIQHIGKRSVLLMKREISQFPGYQMLMTQDITPYYEEIQRQGIHLVWLCCLIWVVTGAAVFMLVHRALKPLRQLTKAAERIGEGNLDERVPVGSQDEIGEFARVFNQMTEKVEGQVEDLQLLSGALAHEIKTPMTAVIGYSDSLLHVKLSEEQQKRALEQIHHAGLRLERLSSKMLNFLGAYENEEIQFEELVVEELFQEVTRETEALWREKQMTIRVEMNAKLHMESSAETNAETSAETTAKMNVEMNAEMNMETDAKTDAQMNGKGSGAPSVTGDRELLLTLLYNLVHNGIKASKPGDRIWLTAAPGWIAVRDEGCGISKKDLPHVTEAFYMADKSRSRSEGGTGLGLALCERIAKLHGIRMEIESHREGDGSGEPGGTKVILHFLEESAGPSVYKTFTS